MSPPELDRATQARLQDLLRREGRSFLQYVRESAPYADPADAPLVQKVRDLAGEELAALERVAVAMQAARIPLPYLGAYPTQFTNYNFVSIRSLLRPLAERQRQEVEALDRDSAALNGVGDVIAEPVRDLLALNRLHLEELSRLAVSPGKSSA